MRPLLSLLLLLLRLRATKAKPTAFGINWITAASMLRGVSIAWGPESGIILLR